MENKITIEKALEITADILRNISVPVGLTQQISVPVSNALRNLEECIAAIRADAEKPKEDPEFEVVDVGTADKIEE